MIFSSRPLGSLARGLLGLAAVLTQAAPAAAADHLRYLPADTRVVVEVNLSALPESDQKAWKKLGELLYGVHLTPELKKKQDDSQFNGSKSAVRDVSSITFATPYAGWPGGMIILRGKVDAKLVAEQARGCARLSRGMVVELKPTRAQPVPVFVRRVSDKGPLLPVPQKVSEALSTLAAGSEIYYAAVDEETLILTVNPLKGLLGLFQPPGRLEILRALMARAKTARPRISETLLALLEKRDRRAWASWVILGNSLEPRLGLLMPELQKTSQRIEHVVGGMREGKEVEGTLVATGKDVDAARELEKHARENAKLMVDVMQTLSEIPRQKKVLTELAQSIQVTRKDAVVTVTAKIAAEKLRLLLTPPTRKKR